MDFIRSLLLRRNNVFKADSVGGDATLHHIGTFVVLQKHLSYNNNDKDTSSTSEYILP